jgi:hypothetical protein
MGLPYPKIQGMLLAPPPWHSRTPERPRSFVASLGDRNAAAIVPRRVDDQLSKTRGIQLSGEMHPNRAANSAGIRSGARKPVNTGYLGKNGWRVAVYATGRARTSSGALVWSGVGSVILWQGSEPAIVMVLRFWSARWSSNVR